MCKRHFRCGVFFAFVWWAALSGAYAEATPDPSATVVFKNGDILTGKLLRVDSYVVQMLSAALGELKIQWPDISEVKTQNGSWKWAGEREGASALVSFRNAVMRKADSGIVMSADFGTVRIPEGGTLMFVKQEHPAASMPQLINPKPSQPSRPDTSVAVSLNAPESVAIGTQSQYVFGGSLRVLHNEPDLCTMPSWFSSLLATANHNKSFDAGSVAVVTDTYNGTLALSNKLGSESQFAGYVVSDYFGNSSLGIGLQQSYGAGVNRVLYSNGCHGTKAVQPKRHLLTVNGDASIRYIHQRLYSPGGSENLAGLRLSEGLLYVMYGRGKSGDSKELFSISQSLWVTPMLNDGRAVQAGASLGISVPLNKSLSVGITEEDDFFNNVPKAKRKNYVQSALTVTYTFPPPPK